LRAAVKAVHPRSTLIMIPPPVVSAPEETVLLTDASDAQVVPARDRVGVRLAGPWTRDGVEIERITEPFRADCLNRVLYQCPHCMSEGQMEGKGTHLTCHACGKVWELTEDGFMRATEGETEFSHIPDWYRFERENVRAAIERGEYLLDVDVEIGMLVNTRAIYFVGEGHLRHDADGFHLTGCDGKLDYRQRPLASYSLYADYYWYEIGDVICIGDGEVLYYCFPRTKGDVVAKTRLAAEELYRMAMAAKNVKKTAAEAASGAEK
jgi:hypothetical protein